MVGNASPYCIGMNNHHQLFSLKGALNIHQVSWKKNNRSIMMPHSRVSIWYLILLTRSSASAFDNFMFGNVSWQHFMNFSTQHNASISATTRPTMADILPHPNAMITPTTSTGMLTSTGNLETATITSNISSMMINDTHKKTSNLTTSPRLWTNNTQVWNDTSASISATPKLTYTKGMSALSVQ